MDRDIREVKEQDLGVKPISINQNDVILWQNFDLAGASILQRSMFAQGVLTHPRDMRARKKDLQVGCSTVR